jgi:hypothetical protein
LHLKKCRQHQRQILECVILLFDAVSQLRQLWRKWRPAHRDSSPRPQSTW